MCFKLKVVLCIFSKNVNLDNFSFFLIYLYINDKLILDFVINGNYSVTFAMYKITKLIIFLL